MNIKHPASYGAVCGLSVGRFFFKTASEEFDGCGVVHQEVFNDDELLPMWRGKVVGKVEKRLWRASGLYRHTQSHLTVSVVIWMMRDVQFHIFVFVFVVTATTVSHLQRPVIRVFGSLKKIHKIPTGQTAVPTSNLLYRVFQLQKKFPGEGVRVNTWLNVSIDHVFLHKAQLLSMWSVKIQIRSNILER